MTQNETDKILSIISETYPIFRKERNPEFTSRLWTAIFQDTPYEQVQQALLEFIMTDTKGFPPMPGAIRERILCHMEPEEMSEIEAWDLTRKAISRSIYYSREEFEKLPAAIRQVVRNPSCLHEWASLDEWQLQNSVAPWFRRAYAGTREKERQNLLLPPAGCSLLESV